ncbi:reverse transcriptase domain-containing protein [Tanacetum coccineum]
MILNLPILTTPLPKKTLFVYLATSKEAVSAVLLVVRKGKQHPVHYVSRTLHDAERNYAPLEKMALALRHVSRRLSRYIWEHAACISKQGRWWQGHSIRILLANDAPGRKRRNTQVRFMPDPLPNTQAPQNVDDFNHGTLAILSVGNGCPRKGWVDELPNVLWAHRTPLKTSNRETPYSLTFGSKAVIPVEIGMPTHRTMMVKEGEGNDEEIRLNLYLLTERRKAAAIWEARYKMKVEQYYNKKVHPMSFKVGEYVYRKNKASRVENLGKLGPKREGPYLVVEAYQNGSYKLRTMDDREVPRVWHAINFRKCYL